LDEHKKAALQ